MNIHHIFHHEHKGDDTSMPKPIDGAENIPMTAEPDEAEIAAQAVLEIILEKKEASSKKSRKRGNAETTKARQSQNDNTEHDADYYRHLAERIREAYAAARQRALRFTCYCEQQLAGPSLPLYGKGSLSLLEAELYKRLDVVEREGGDLKKRWQHCLAEVTIRLMNASTKTNDKH